MRRRRKRNSFSPSDRYSENPTPEMAGLGIASGGTAGMGAMAAVSGYRDTSNRSDRVTDVTRSDLASQQRPSPPPRSPDRLLPFGAAAIRSWSVGSPPAQSSHMSVSDQSEYSQGNNNHQSPDGNQHKPQQQPPAPAPAGAAPAAPAVDGGEGYAAGLSELPSNQRSVHQLPDDDVMSHQSYQQANRGDDGYWTGRPSNLNPSNPSAPSASAEEAQELPGQSPTPAAAYPTQGNGYRGVDPEVPLHQRMDNSAGGGGGKVPVRHYGPSHNF